MEEREDGGRGEGGGRGGGKRGRRGEGHLLIWLQSAHGLLALDAGELSAGLKRDGSLGEEGKEEGRREGRREGGRRRGEKGRKGKCTESNKLESQKWQCCQNTTHISLQLEHMSTCLGIFNYRTHLGPHMTGLPVLNLASTLPSDT